MYKIHKRKSKSKNYFIKIANKIREAFHKNDKQNQKTNIEKDNELKEEEKMENRKEVGYGSNL